MKVHFVGNTCNNHYGIAKELRKQGVNAHLFIPYGQTLTTQTLPESEDPELRDNYPKWIHKMKKVSSFRRLGYIAAQDQKQLFDCDIITTHGEYASTIAKNKPYVIFPHGSDLYLYPFKKFRHPRLCHMMPSPKYWGINRRMRSGYRMASAIVGGFYAYMLEEAFEVLFKRKRIAPIGV